MLDHFRIGVVCANLREKGLCLRNLVATNLYLVRKWSWKFPLELDSLWHHVIKKTSVNLNKIGGTRLLQITA